TENDRLRPLSLVDDVLHAWPEYYDKDKKQWVMIDPTWGNTTKGMDYFNTLDFEHITFVVKGLDSEYPIPAGGYKFDKKSMDIEIQFVQADNAKPSESFARSATSRRLPVPEFAVEGEFIIKNTVNTPTPNGNAVVPPNFPFPTNRFVDDIPPFGAQRVTV